MNMYEYPWFLLGILILALLFLIVYMKIENQLGFQKKLQLIKFGFILGVISVSSMLVFSALVLVPIVNLIFKQSIFIGVIFILFASALLVLYLLPLISIMKACIRLLKSFKHEAFFLDENVKDVQIIAQCTNCLLLINLFILLLNCLITLGTGSILTSASNDFGFESWTGQFLAVLLLNLASLLFAKSTELYKENRLTI